MAGFNWAAIPQVGREDDPHLLTNVQNRIADMEARLARLQAAKAEMAMADPANRALANQLMPDLVAAEQRLILSKQQLIQFERMERDRIAAAAAAAAAPPPVLSQGQQRKAEQKADQKAREREQRVQDINDMIDDLTGPSANLSALINVGGVVQQCQVAHPVHTFPPPDADVANLCTAITQRLTVSRPILQNGAHQTVFQGKSIAVAKLADGSFVVAVSGANDYATTVVQDLTHHFGAPPTFQGHPVSFRSDLVPNLANNMEAPPTTQPLGARACAMPKVYYQAAQVGSAVASVTEIWWPDGNHANPANDSPAANPYPDPAHATRMVPCEYCAWNRQIIQNGGAWA